MGAFIIILIVIVGILLSLVILVQNPKGGGLASGFTGASQIGGVQKTADFLEKSTWYLTAALFVLCLAAAKFKPGTGVGAGTGDSLGDDAIEQMIEPGTEGDVVEGAEGAEGAPAQGNPAEGAPAEGATQEATPQNLEVPGQQ
jgi:preprotein translocase subunit SecG